MACIPARRRYKGITEMTPPMDKQQLASFIGMVTYMGNFVPHLSHHTEPLCAMLKQDAVFAWDEMANASFQKIKDLIAKSATKPLCYYDRRKPVTVQVDASKEDLVHDYCRMASQLHTPARASQTLRPGTQT